MSSTTQSILLNQFQAALSSTKYSQPVNKQAPTTQERAMARHKRYSGKTNDEVFEMCQIGEEIEVENKYRQSHLLNITAKSGSMKKVKTSLGYWAYYEGNGIWRF